MVIKEKGLRIDKKGNLQLDKRCKEHYYNDQPERLNPEDAGKGLHMSIKEMKKENLFNEKTSFEDVCNYAGSHICICDSPNNANK